MRGKWLTIRQEWWARRLVRGGHEDATLLCPPDKGVALCFFVLHILCLQGISSSSFLLSQALPSVLAIPQQGAGSICSSLEAMAVYFHNCLVQRLLGKHKGVTFGLSTQPGNDPSVHLAAKVTPFLHPTVKKLEENTLLHSQSVGTVPILRSYNVVFEYCLISCRRCNRGVIPSPF